MPGSLWVISGPSGAGKGTILQKVLQEVPDTIFSVSATTRAARPGERDGVHYHFRSEAQFQEMIAAQEFLEWARVHGAYYGTPKAWVEEKLQRNYDVILDIDVQGALQVMKVKPEAFYVFIAPPTVEDLRKRLLNRGTETADKIDSRVKTARWELTQVPQYDYVIINDDLQIATAQCKALIEAQRCHVSRLDTWDFGEGLIVKINVGAKQAKR